MPIMWRWPPPPIARRLLLKGIGIATLKIEGRYKDADYVALATAAYRQAVDEAWAGRELKLDRAAELRLEQVYSRGLGPFFLTGTNHQKVVEGRAPRHRGVLMGRVLKVTDSGVSIEPSEAQRISPLKPGDGVVFDAADWRSPEEPEEGGRIFEIERGELRFGNGAIHGDRIRRGDLVWRTHDPDVDKAARVYTEAAVPLRKQSVALRVVAHEGDRLRTVWTVGAVHVTGESEAPLGAARHRCIDEEYLRQQLGRLGNTPYELAEVTLEIAGAPFAPSSMLNQLRRDAVDQLQMAQGKPGDRPHVPHFVRQEIGERGVCPRVSTLHLLVRTAEQLDAALELEPTSITLDYLDLYGLRPSIARVQIGRASCR